MQDLVGVHFGTDIWNHWSVTAWTKWRIQGDENIKYDRQERRAFEPGASCILEIAKGPLEDEEETAKFCTTYTSTSDMMEIVVGVPEERSRKGLDQRTRGRDQTQVQEEEAEAAESAERPLHVR